MILRHLHINNFKNIAEADIRFSEKTNCFLGNNGMGKSNLLDAIYYLSFCKSFSGQTDSLLIRRDSGFMMLSADYLRHGEEESLQFGFKEGHKKSFKRGGKEYRRLSEHIGLFPLVMIAPSDNELVSGTAEVRRKFVDRIISQTDAEYLARLISYNYNLEARNKLLRETPPQQYQQMALLFEAVTLPLARAADYISEARRRFTEEFTPIFQHYYSAIAPENSEKVEFGYLSTLSAGNPPYAEQLAESLPKDFQRGYTTRGIHRDDFDMLIDSMPVRKAASQGQIKTFVVAMRLAQYEFLARTAGLKPMLLLDDVFDRLDSTRVERIIDIVSTPDFGQIFITDTNRHHLHAIMHRRAENSGSPAPYRLWQVDHGSFTLLEENEKD